MQKVPLGKTGLNVSPVAYAAIVSMNEAQADSDAYVALAVSAGVNYFDVAPSYGDAEVVMGKSLRPYRKDVYLACKTAQRTRALAEKELRNSLKVLHTDWFDVYQLHAMTTPDDVEQAFGPDGVMELLVKMRQEGVIRHIGFSAHSERAAMECLERYPFDTVMYPLNWMLHKGQGIGEDVRRAKEERGFGLIGLKALIERAWEDDAEKGESPWPKSWCKPFDAKETDLRLAGMKYALDLGVDILVPPGNWECQRFMMEHADECLANPLSETERTLLDSRMQAVGDKPFFRKDNGGWQG